MYPTPPWKKDKKGKKAGGNKKIVREPTGDNDKRDGGSGRSQEVARCCTLPPSRVLWLTVTSMLLPLLAPPERRSGDDKLAGRESEPANDEGKATTSATAIN